MAGSVISARKVELRALYRARNSSLSTDQRRAISDRVCHHLETSLLGSDRPRIIGVYAQLASELSLNLFLAAAQRAGVQLAFPRRAAGSRVLDFIVVKDLDDELTSRGDLTLREPSPSAPAIRLESLGALVVPGLAFTAQGYRLGMGGGYYDATLPRCAGARRIGVCPAQCIALSLPLDAHDARVDRVATEDGWVVDSSAQ